MKQISENSITMNRKGFFLDMKLIRNFIKVQEPNFALTLKQIQHLSNLYCNIIIYVEMYTRIF